MAPNEDQIYNAILANAPQDGTMYTEEELRNNVSRYRIVLPITDAAAEQILKNLQVQLSIKMDVGAVIIEEAHTPWLNGRKAKLDQFFWERYRKQLVMRDKWPPLVVNTLDGVADEILDLAGDPQQTTNYRRKGLIVGDVQSGKTATYTAIACKAADAGYRLIVLLTGTIESLRRQTQIRLDEGFIGRDSSVLLQKNLVATKSLVGVGLIDGRRTATSFTSRSQDFSKVIATQLGFSIVDSKVPVLMVCKKNAKILENLRSWLETMNANQGKIDVPLLLIDDEADSASINTSADNENATRTNMEIRQLLRLFHKSTYIGVTATPFANVFIHPDSRDDMLGDDLFPSSFIYALEPPSNYIGPERIFSDGIDGLISPLDDAELDLPVKHKIDHIVQRLPDSLSHAIRCFLLATTIRDLRSEGPTHRSMLVNVSRFTAVQERVRAAIDDDVRQSLREIRLFAALTVDDALRACAYLRGLHDTWFREFSKCGFSWDEVQNALIESTSPIVVTAVNQKSGSSGLNYEGHKQSGLRVIAVGGNSLSRGLTLEGLSTSYFYRNSIMYDTLLQMGRWFGYRGAYSDLCRLFLSADAESWFSHITQATIDLRAQLRQMQSRGLTPSEFGLKVRAHPDSLIVTARNKMRSAQDFEHYISLSENLLETTRLIPRQAILDANFSATEAFAHSLPSFPRLPSNHSWYTHGPIPSNIIARFLKIFVSDPSNFHLQLDPIADFINTTGEATLQAWDVTIVNATRGKEEPFTFAGLNIRPVRRHITHSAETSSILISGPKARVGSMGSESEGLSSEEVRSIQASYAQANPDKSIPDKEYRKHRKRPLLLIFLVNAYEGDPEVKFRANENPLIALGLSFPEFDDSSVATQVPYKINVVEWRSRLATVATDDHIEDYDDEY